MPRVADQIGDCSIYLYASTEAATGGAHTGGCGFLVSVPSQINKAYGQLYAVTNKHVLDGGFHVLRLTKKGGGIDTIVTQRQDWTPHPRGYDVEVMPIDIPDETFQYWSIEAERFITSEIIKTYRLGLGDDAFLVGRLITHAGIQKNAPITRFGNISLMADPTEPIRCKGYDQEGFLVECRSLSGFSGSPVFVQTDQYYRGEDAERVAEHRQSKSTSSDSGVQIKMVSISGQFGPWLLGIDWGHIPLWRPVFEEDKETETGFQVEANTGVACVLPAWHILETLNDEELVKNRHKEDQKLVKRLATEGAAVIAGASRAVAKKGNNLGNNRT
jgi:hypothetical protein